MIGHSHTNSAPRTPFFQFDAAYRYKGMGATVINVISRKTEGILRPGFPDIQKPPALHGFGCFSNWLTCVLTGTLFGSWVALGKFREALRKASGSASLR